MVEDGYMLLGVLQALNPLSNRVTFIAIVPGAYPGRPKCAKMANFWTYGLNYWETVEDRWVHAGKSSNKYKNDLFSETWCSCNSRLIESHTCSIEPRHFQWPWRTPNPDFKVRPFCDAEYLQHGCRYGYMSVTMEGE